MSYFEDLLLSSLDEQPVILDISSYQTYIAMPDFEKIVRSRILFQNRLLPIVGVIVKATEGDYGYYDPKYPTVLDLADQVRLFTGSYHFSHAQYPAWSQANFFTSKYQTRSRNLGAWNDVEEPGDLKYFPAGKRYKIISHCYDFCFRVASTTKGRCGVYTGSWYWDQCEPQLERPFYQMGIEGWNAYYNEWGEGQPRFLPIGWKTYDIHQFSSSAQIPGIIGRVDVNVFRGKVRDLFSYAGLSVPSGEKPPVPKHDHTIYIPLIKKGA